MMFAWSELHHIVVTYHFYGSICCDTSEVVMKTSRIVMHYIILSSDHFPVLPYIFDYDTLLYVLIQWDCFTMLWDLPLYEFIFHNIPGVDMKVCWVSLYQVEYVGNTLYYHDISFLGSCSIICFSVMLLCCKCNAITLYIIFGFSLLSIIGIILHYHEILCFHLFHPLLY